MRVVYQVYESGVTTFQQHTNSITCINQLRANVTQIKSNDDCDRWCRYYGPSASITQQRHYSHISVYCINTTPDMFFIQFKLYLAPQSVSGKDYMSALHRPRKVKYHQLLAKTLINSYILHFNLNNLSKLFNTQKLNTVSLMRNV